MATICASTPLNAQDLEPRAYSASPVGTWFASVGFGRSSGSIAFDPTVPITNAKATFHFPALGLGHTFGVFGRQALLTAVLPYAWGNASGNVGDQSGMVYRSGLADVKAKFSINLRGNPAMTPREFAQRLHRRTILGASLTMSAPSGQYSGEKLINISTNRWSFKPELGISVPVKKFYLDLYGSDTFFTANSNFYPGQSLRTQAQLPAIQAHASYTVRRGLWVAVDATWYGGGASKINGGAPSERQSNTRLGTQVSLPLPDRQSLKFAYSSGVNARVGFQFNTLSVGWQYMWFGGP
ncbi:transporter [Edaphobacter bradus]|uniref:transporter n=1 Tax=Edaphobacter bradus TaxID=2259016 RepID=UPI0021E0461D|nr:transporter [Edaphobacter bradus]